MIANIRQYKCKDNTELMELDGEWVLFQGDSCTVTKLNELGGFIWSKLKQQHTESEIIRDITEEYEVEHEVAERDFRLFRDHLLEIGLLTSEQSGE